MPIEVLMHAPKRAIAAAAIGNALEWYDFGLYGFLSLTLQALFFPFQSSTKGLLSVFLVFAVGLFMRPLGGILFGYIGDKIGRKIALVASIAAMALPTFSIAFLPTYNQAGAFAVVLLVIARLVQGLSVGGEMMGSIVFLAEHASPYQRGLTTSMIYCVGTLGGLFGSLTGALLYWIFPEKTILTWAWRLPFFLGFFIGLFGLYLRLKVQETPLFLKLKHDAHTARRPFREAIEEHYKEILIIFVLVSLQAVSFYIPFVYLPTWLTTQAHFSRTASFLVNSVGLLFVVLLIPVFATLSDRIGRKKILMMGALLTCLFSYPLFSLLSRVKATASPIGIALTTIILFSILIGIFQGPLAATLAELLTTKNRYMSLVIGYNTSAALFGGISPYLATALISLTGFSEAPSFILIATGLAALIVLIFFVKETYRSCLH